MQTRFPSGWSARFVSLDSWFRRIEIFRVFYRNLIDHLTSVSNLSIYMTFDHGSIRLRWRDRLYLLPTQWRMICLATSAVVLAGAAIQLRYPKLYEASARLVFDPVPDDSSAYFIAQGGGASASGNLRDRARELVSKELLAGIIAPGNFAQRWGTSDEVQLLTLLASRVHVGVDIDANSLILKARDLSPAHAATLANTIATRFIQNREQVAKAGSKALILRLEKERKVAEQASGVIEAQLLALAKQNANQRNREIDELRQRLVGQHNLIHSLDAKLQLARLDAETRSHTVRIAEAASPKVYTFSRPYFLGIIPLLIAGLTSGVLSAFLVMRKLSLSEVSGEMMDRLHLPLVGFAPLTGHLIPRGANLRETVLEPYRDLRNRLLRNPTGKCALYAIQPSRPNDATAEVTVNLASILADAGHATLLVDAHLRHQSLHQAFDSVKDPGLSDYLCRDISLEDTVIRTSYPNLWLLPAGSDHPDPGSLLSGRKMEDLVWELKRRFDFVLIKTPSVEESSDATLIGALVDYVLVVSPLLRLSKRRIREIQAILEMGSARLNGVIITAEDESSVIQPIMPVAEGIAHGTLKGTSHAKWISRMRTMLHSGKQAVEAVAYERVEPKAETSEGSPSENHESVKENHEKQSEPSPWAIESGK